MKSLPVAFVRQLFCTALVASHGALAYPGGISGYSGQGADCAQCHYGGSGTPTATLTGPTTLAAGTSATFTLTISGGPAAVGGLDVSADNGAASLTASDPNTYLSSGEVTQGSSTAFTSGVLSFTFGLTAPANPGSVTLYASALSADGDGSRSGDSTVDATLIVTVVASGADAGATSDGGGGDGSGAGGGPGNADAGFGPGNSGSSRSSSTSIFGGCSASLGGASQLLLLTLLLAPLALWRRRAAR